LIASDLGYIAHLFRRFHGGGSNALSPTNDVGNYSKTFFGSRTLADFSGAARAQFAMRKCFGRHDAAFPPSKSQGNKLSCRTARIVRMQSCS
jgi:hypothetical protein